MLFFIFVPNSAASLQVYPHSRCVRRALYRRAVGHGRLPGSHRLGDRNPPGRHHHLPVLWDLCERAEWSWQYGSAAFLISNLPISWHIQRIHLFFFLFFLQLVLLVYFTAGISNFFFFFLTPPFLFSTILLLLEKSVLVTLRAEHTIGCHSSFKIFYFFYFCRGFCRLPESPSGCSSSPLTLKKAHGLWVAVFDLPQAFLFIIVGV